MPLNEITCHRRETPAMFTVYMVVIDQDYLSYYTRMSVVGGEGQ